nr:hypothetical protein [Candidatus Sigynarchaeum springense]
MNRTDRRPCRTRATPPVPDRDPPLDWLGRTGKPGGPAPRGRIPANVH